MHILDILVFPEQTRSSLSKGWLEMALWRSTVGKKVVMAITGLIMVLFLIAHMLGNLNFHLGAEAINSYARHLEDLGPVLWAARGFFILALGLHVWAGISLALENARARGTKYAVRQYKQAGLPSRSMIYTGPLIFAFGVYHLLHFTFQVTDPQIYHYVNGHVDVYRMAGLSFVQPLTLLFYFAGLAAVLLHLWHGLGSLFQSMGWNNDRSMPVVNLGSRVVVVALIAAYLSVPLAFLWLGL